jgi:hypothetical protein
LLRSILNLSSGEIIGDPQFLLDFAIIGFPKCGTTALQEWLSQHSQIQMLGGEVFSLLNQQPSRMIWRLYTQLPSSPQIVRGYKNPLDIRAPPTLRYLSQYFPQTTLIVGVRHPVRWFESLYNFKVQNLPRNVDPSYWGDPNELIHACGWWNDTNCVGTAKGWFHVHLAALGKVPFPEEWKDQYPMYLKQNTSPTKVPNPVFLYESQQLVFDDETSNNQNARQFRMELQRILHLNASLPSILPRTKPDFDHFNKRQQRRKDQHKIDICHAKYQPVRTELMRLSRQASLWIRNELLNSPEVQVSSPDYFRELLERWMVDPCDEVVSKR